MGKYKAKIIQDIENLQMEYGECKIDTNEFVKRLNELGIYTSEEVDFHLAEAEDSRFEYKMDQAAEQAKGETVIAMPFPEKDAG